VQVEDYRPTFSQERLEQQEELQATGSLDWQSVFGTTDDEGSITQYNTVATGNDADSLGTSYYDPSGRNTASPGTYGSVADVNAGYPGDMGAMGTEPYYDYSSVDGSVGGYSSVTGGGQWTQYSDDQGYPYWYNNYTGVSQYEDPFGSSTIATSY